MKLTAPLLTTALSLLDNLVNLIPEPDPELRRLRAEHRMRMKEMRMARRAPPGGPGGTRTPDPMGVPTPEGERP